MMSLLNKWDKLNILFLIVVNFILTDLPLPTLLKILLSALPFIVLAVIYFSNRNFSVFFSYLLIYTFSYPFGPRGDLTDQSGEIAGYFSYTNLNIGFLSLSLFSLLLFTWLECQKEGLIPKLVYNGFIFFLCLIAYSIFNSIFAGFYLKYFITDLKPFVLFFFGIFFGYCLWFRFRLQIDYIFLKILYTWTLVYFGKTVLYLCYDLIKGNELSNFGTIPYLFLPILFTVMFTIRDSKTRYFLIFAAFISSFSISRGFFIMLGALAIVVPSFYIRRNDAIKVIGTYVVFLIILISLYSFSSLFLSERAQIFLDYKLNFFSNELGSSEVELNRSTYIRVLEFQNIWSDITSNPVYFLFGKGVGSYFEFKAFPISLSMLNDNSTDAFSLDQRELNKFFRPHTFVITGLLKGGLVLVVLFSFYNFRHFFRMATKFKKAKSLDAYFIAFSGIFTSLFFFYYWIPEFLFLNGLILGYFKYRLSYENK